MERDIIFKFWNKRKKKMLQGEHDVHKGFPMIGNFIWLQFTELKDITGSKIFDGDILFNDDCNCYCEVKMVNGGWKTIYPANTLESKESIYALEKSIGNLYKKVGNIYENPELLKTT